MFEILEPRFVADQQSIRDLAAACRKNGVFALDTEADSLHSYFHKVCLLQVTVATENVVVDPLALSAADLRPLFDVLEDEDIIVLMHGADYDVRVLDRDYGARINGLQDTQIMAHLLGEERTGLAALLNTELGIELDKKYQRADWGRRPLTQSMLSYAAADTAHLASLAQRLIARLEEVHRWQWAQEEFRKLERVRYTPTPEDPYQFERVKGVSSLRGALRDRAFSLFQWRDTAARRLDVPPFKVLGNRQLVELASSPPVGLEDLVSRKGLGHRFGRRWGREVLSIARNPKSAPERRRQARQPGPAAVIRARIDELLAARDVIARELEIQPSLLCPRAMAVDLAQPDVPPVSIAALADRGLTGWRLDVLGESFFAVLTKGQK